MNNKWKVKEIVMSDIVGTETNANSMSNKDFSKLCRNIGKSGLSSMIACYLRKDGKYVIISGNHRYKACLKLGYSKLHILYAKESELSKDEIVALQLSHNTLHGSDDKGILKRLFDEIESVDYREFAHISVDDLMVDDMFSASIVPVSEHYRVSFVLYRRDIELIEELLEIIREENEVSDMVILADGANVEDDFLDALTAVRSEFGIRSPSIALGKVLQLAKEALSTKVTENDKKEK